MMASKYILILILVFLSIAMVTARAPRQRRFSKSDKDAGTLKSQEADCGSKEGGCSKRESGSNEKPEHPCPPGGKSGKGPPCPVPPDNCLPCTIDGKCPPCPKPSPDHGGHHDDSDDHIFEAVFGVILFILIIAVVIAGIIFACMMCCCNKQERSQKKNGYRPIDQSQPPVIIVTSHPPYCHGDRLLPQPAGCLNSNYAARYGSLGVVGHAYPGVRPDAGANQNSARGAFNQPGTYKDNAPPSAPPYSYTPPPTSADRMK